MASPFRLFRKYMKPMMVVLCGMAMLAFVVVDPLMQYWSASARGDGAGRDGSKVVVTWKDGQLTENELGALVERRHMLAAFLQAVYETGFYAAEREGVEDLGLSVKLLQLTTNPAQIEKDVVRTQIFADAARRMGMTIDDEEVKDYLDKLGRNRVSFQQMKLIVDSFQQRIPSQYILDAVRDELLRQNYLSSYLYAAYTVMPDQQWNDWLRANDRVIVEAAAIKTSDYMDQAPEPTDAEVREFYEKYKEDEVQPVFPDDTELPSPLPGFQIPRKVTLQYLEGTYDVFLQKVMDSITEEEIAKYYEENKELFVKAASGAAEAAPAEDAPEGAAPSDEAEKELFDVPEKSDTEAPEEPPAKPAGPESDTPEAEQPQDEQSRRTGVSPFRLVAMQAEAGTEPPAAEETPPGEPSAKAETPAAPAETATEPATEPPAVNESQASDVGAAEKPAEEKPPEYQSLDEVRDEIRRLLAGSKGNDQLRETMNRLASEMNTAYLSYLDKQLTARSNKQPAPEPSAILKDLQPLAEPNGLTFHKTEPMSLWELREAPVGQSGDANESVEQQFPLWAMMFGRLKDYEPIVTFDLQGNRYLSLKTSDTPQRVPPLKEIRAQVVEAWKREKASELALAAAKKAAKEIETGGVTIGDKFAGDSKVEVVVTDPFTWLTVGDVSPTTRMVTFRLSDAAPIVAAGPEFMDTVFNLGEGKVGAVFNNDHSIAYVVRVQQHLEGREELQRDFLSEVSTWFGAATMQQSRVQGAFLGVIDELLEQADIDWKRPPDQANQGDEQNDAG